MTNITEGDLTFSFPDYCQASKYDDWPFYRNQFQAVAGASKAVDILCVECNTSRRERRMASTAWLIEIKDYRQHTRKKCIDIADDLARKVRDTLAGLWRRRQRWPTKLTSANLRKKHWQLANGESCSTWNNQLRYQDYGQRPSTLPR